MFIQVVGSKNHYLSKDALPERFVTRRPFYVVIQIFIHSTPGFASAKISLYPSSKSYWKVDHQDRVVFPSASRGIRGRPAIP